MLSIRLIHLKSFTTDTVIQKLNENQFHGRKKQRKKIMVSQNEWSHNFQKHITAISTVGCSLSHLLHFFFAFIVLF